MRFFLFVAIALFAEELQSPLKDVSKEYQENYYFHYWFYIDDAEEKGDTVKATLKAGRPYEGDIGVILDELTRPGSIAIDCGAHIGVHTITLSKKVGAQGKVFSFEPNKKLYSEQLYNLALNYCENVNPICKAVGADFGRAFLKWGKIEKREAGEGYFVDIVPIDSYQLENVSLIKMDIENYEYAALQGARETILKNRPIVVFECMLNCQFGDISKQEQKDNFRRVASFFEDLGYEIRVIHCCNFIAFPLALEFPLSLYREKFMRLEIETYDPERFVPLGEGLSYFRSWSE